MYTVTASIVTYHNPPGLLNQAIASFLNTALNVKLFVSDNSATDALRNQLPADNRIEYRFNNANLGFGKAHNLILKEVAAISEFHIILNPDVVYDDPLLLTKMVAFAQSDKKVGAIMPKVVYPDGETQFLAKLLPSPLDLITRRFLPFLANKNFDLAFTGYANTMDVPFITGCFMFVKTAVLKDVGLFDDRYFMYCEDLDLSRRINAKYRTVFYPEVEIVHHYAKGSYKNKNLLKIHLQSAFLYFNKWGWFFDRQRRFANKITLEKIAAGNLNRSQQ